jgi:hypothetical protein
MYWLTMDTSEHADHLSCRKSNQTYHWLLRNGTRCNLDYAISSHAAGLECPCRHTIRCPGNVSIVEAWLILETVDRVASSAALVTVLV